MPSAEFPPNNPPPSIVELAHDESMDRRGRIASSENPLLRRAVRVSVRQAKFSVGLFRWVRRSEKRDGAGRPRPARGELKDVCDVDERRRFLGSQGLDHGDGDDDDQGQRHGVFSCRGAPFFFSKRVDAPGKGFHCEHLPRVVQGPGVGPAGIRSAAPSRRPHSPPFTPAPVPRRLLVTSLCVDSADHLVPKTHICSARSSFRSLDACAASLSAQTPGRRTARVRGCDKNAVGPTAPPHHGSRVESSIESTEPIRVVRFRC